MDEIKTKIDDVFDFIQKKGKTTSKEVRNGLKISGDDLDTYLYVLRRYGMIEVKYDWFETYLYINEDNALKLADEFKSQLSNADSTVIFDKQDATNKNIKALAFMSTLKTD
jgi:transcription initiation factor IIE alpha subunit